MMDLSVYLWLGNDTIFLLVCFGFLALAVMWYVSSVARITKEMNESMAEVGLKRKRVGDIFVYKSQENPAHVATYLESYHL